MVELWPAETVTPEHINDLHCRLKNLEGLSISDGNLFKQLRADVDALMARPYCPPPTLLVHPPCLCGHDYSEHNSHPSYSGCKKCSCRIYRPEPKPAPPAPAAPARKTIPTCPWCGVVRYADVSHTAAECIAKGIPRKPAPAAPAPCPLCGGIARYWVDNEQVPCPVCGAMNTTSAPAPEAVDQDHQATQQEKAPNLVVPRRDTRGPAPAPLPEGLICPRCRKPYSRGHFEGALHDYCHLWTHTEGGPHDEGWEPPKEAGK